MWKYLLYKLNKNCAEIRNGCQNIAFSLGSLFWRTLYTGLSPLNRNCHISWCIYVQKLWRFYEKYQNFKLTKFTNTWIFVLTHLLKLSRDYCAIQPIHLMLTLLTFISGGLCLRNINSIHPNRQILCNWRSCSKQYGERLTTRDH